MFTGIIESTAQLRSFDGNQMWIDVAFSGELQIGQSVACDGVCLTVVEVDEVGFRVDLLEETRRLTRFSGLHPGDLINVERAMRIGGRFDGHIVQAHCEGLGLIKKIAQENEDDSDSQTYLISLQVPKDMMRYMIYKGIIILNGIALTLSNLDDDRNEIEVAIIPHTWEDTNLHVLSEGDSVHVETDVIARFAERMMVDV